ncbi:MULTISPECIES: TetR/AcrR family transcriptional regulator [unclassified Planococcus (in: firmicutes)]|uniref:TetR/AcrR family transcriptional regulator n=1 Tax=unclassified Planococcus (in: firmicutes) TaxID=2662419 RepID=UPI000C31C707|nr:MULTISPECIES: TetR/AcrR family transcriptional regulator [unclassified Planococcus (in: firmicutes)]AUD14424.1 TetR/AcrR family transcriptional regulator [Planococcus sp. MB-3u-03]PKG44699.1 TetR/AcrR family transcriptional regulator [Planococcus sp. Urea-trap-24]PKG87043.1 TetR/AcrR family transcriptional regulator [Planococcus sp. Urea-3u-39]PKH41097.1 TetR/AcrR family transcriptional regulator [Planococcus sp. MB-3u-09]
MPSKRQENKQLQTDKIVEAAKELFTERGLNDVQMKDVAERAGAGVATVFRYFPKKDELIVEVAIRSLDAVEAEFQRIISMKSSAFERLEQLLDTLLDAQKAEQYKSARFREAFESYASFRTEPLPEIDRYLARQRQIMDLLEPLIQDGQRDGSINSSIPAKPLIVTIINSYSSFTNNVALKSSISYLDEDIQPETQQKVLKKILLDYCRA